MLQKLISLIQLGIKQLRNIMSESYQAFLFLSQMLKIIQYNVDMYGINVDYYACFI